MDMKRTLILAVALLAGATAFAQQALGPASGIISPEINPDHSVTFRYRGPKAVTVQLTGDFLPTRKIEYEQNGQKQVYEAAAAETPAHRVLLMK